MILTKIETSSSTGNSFLELVDDCFWAFTTKDGKFSGDDSKIKLNFGHRPASRERGRNSNMPDLKIDYYISLRTWNDFWYLYQSGALMEKLAALKQNYYLNGQFVDENGNRMDSTLYSFDIGGTREKSLCRKGYLIPATKREDDMRNGTFNPRKEYPAVIMVVEQGPGEVADSGIIIPRFSKEGGKKNYDSIMVPLTFKEFNGFFSNVERFLNAEITRLYLCGVMKPERSGNLD